MKWTLCNPVLLFLHIFVSVVWICFYLVFEILPVYRPAVRLFCIAISVYCLSPMPLFQPYCHSEVTSCGETRAHALTVKRLTIHHLFYLICLWTGCAHLTRPEIQNPKKMAKYLFYFFFHFIWTFSTQFYNINLLCISYILVCMKHKISLSKLL